MSDTLDLTELFSIEGLPGIKDQDGAPLEEFKMPELDKIVSNPTERSKDLEADYMAVRDNVYFQQQLLRLMALKAYENASMSDSPRQVEVFSTLMTQMTNNNKQILDVQKAMKEITQEQVKTSSSETVVKAEAGATVFVGSPAELMARRGGQLEAKAKRERGQELDGDIEDAETN